MPEGASSAITSVEFCRGSFAQLCSATFRKLSSVFGASLIFEKLWRLLVGALKFFVRGVTLCMILANLGELGCSKSGLNRW
jgi:hypothetical protein